MSAFRIFKKVITRPSIGEILKEARLKKSVSLQEIEEAAKIRIKYLEAIEEERWEDLPQGPYILGFLQKYCQYIEVPFEKIKKYYQREIGTREVLEKKMIPERKEVKQPRVYITPAVLASSFLILVIVGVVSYIVYQILGFAGAPYLLIESPQGGSIVLQDTITIEGKTQKGTSLYINGQLLAIGTEGNFRQEVKLKEGSNNINIVALNKAGKKTEKNLIILHQISNRSEGRQFSKGVEEEK